MINSCIIFTKVIDFAIGLRRTAADVAEEIDFTMEVYCSEKELFVSISRNNLLRKLF